MPIRLAIRCWFTCRTPHRQPPIANCQVRLYNPRAMFRTFSSTLLALFLAVAASAQTQTAAATPPIALLERNLQRIIQHTKADWAIYVKSLDTGEEVAINADAPFDTMS